MRSLLYSNEGADMRYFRITDECGMTFLMASSNDEKTAEEIEMLTPYVRKAEEITQEQYFKEGGTECL